MSVYHKVINTSDKKLLITAELTKNYKTFNVSLLKTC